MSRRRRDAASVRSASAARALARLVRVMATLRSPAGCPWDREQTHASLRAHLIEETYEAIDAIDRRDMPALTAELGDVLFQCVFHAQIAAERGEFDLADAIASITTKLVRRHPHVFTAAGRPLGAGRRRASDIRTAAAVKAQWETIKAAEQQQAGRERRVLAGVPAAMPALLRAHEIGRRVAAVGFDWPRAGDVVDKIDEEVRELRAAVAEGGTRAAEELGDLLFSMANLARKLGIEPEAALRAANDKFTRRFGELEARFDAAGRGVHGATLDELEAAWAAVKALEPPAAPAPPRRRPSSSGRGRGGRPSRS
jgi:MazG family protein